MRGGDARDCDEVRIVVVVTDEKACTTPVVYSGPTDTNTRAATRRTIECDSLVVDVYRCRPGISFLNKHMPSLFVCCSLVIVRLARLLHFVLVHQLSLFSNQLTNRLIDCLLFHSLPPQEKKKMMMVPFSSLSPVPCNLSNIGRLIVLVREQPNHTAKRSSDWHAHIMHTYAAPFVTKKRPSSSPQGAVAPLNPGPLLYS